VLSVWLAWFLLAPAAHTQRLGSPPATTVDGDSAKGFIALFEARYQQARTLQARFLESYTDNGDVQRTEAGIAYFRRPGKMRFEYEAPERNLFLVDGKTAWFYVPSDRTVMRVPAKESTDWRTPLALLAGEMKVSRVCVKVALAAEEKTASEGNVVLRCLLRGATPERATGSASANFDPASAGPAVDAVFFEIGRHTGELARLLVRQKGGVQVEFKFTGWRANPPVPESLFHWDSPAGVAIVNGELPSSDAGVK
jgi:outer membrane lipoprotein carrier protein